MALEGRIVLVTGSISGIGLGIARRLGATGAGVALNGFGDGAAGGALRAPIAAEHGRHTMLVQADMSGTAACAAMVEAVTRELGGLDILLHGTGIQTTDALDVLPTESWIRVIAVDLSGAFYSLRATMPVIRILGLGRVMHIAFAYALVGPIHKATHVAAMHRPLGLAKAAALEHANASVTVNAAWRGRMRRPLVEPQVADRAEQAGTGVETAARELLAEEQPMLRFSTPEYNAAALHSRCSHAAETVTGARLATDIGWTEQ